LGSGVSIMVMIMGDDGEEEVEGVEANVKGDVEGCGVKMVAMDVVCIGTKDIGVKGMRFKFVLVEVVEEVVALVEGVSSMMDLLVLFLFSFFIADVPEVVGFFANLKTLVLDGRDERGGSAFLVSPVESGAVEEPPGKINLELLVIAVLRLCLAAVNVSCLPLI